MTVKTARPTPAFPGDGPLMKWITANAKPLLYEHDDKKTFARELARYRKARDNRTAHGIIRFNIVMDNLSPAVINLAEEQLSFTATVSFGMTYLRENHGDKCQLSIGTRTEMPIILSESLHGKYADAIVSLPGTLQPIIAGRKITKVCRNSEWMGWLILMLENEPW